MPDLTLALNRSERVYLAMEGVAGAIAQTHVLRLRTSHTADQLRAATRALVRNVPRLRARLRSTFLGWRLAVLPDGDEVDRLFAEAWRVVPGVGEDETRLQAFLTALANEPFDLRRGPLLRVRLLTGGSHPLLVFNLHHVVCDGRGMLDLMGRLMAHLNGDAAPPPLPLDRPSMIPALLPAPPTLARSLRSLWRSLWLSRRNRAAGRRFRTVVAGTPLPDFGPTAVRVFQPRASLTAIKEAARRRDCTVTELMIAALAGGFAGDADRDGHNAVTVRVSIDLRPFFEAARRPQFGNYVASCLLSLPRWGDLTATINDVRQQLRENVGRFQRHEMSFPLIGAEVTPWLLGRKLLGTAARLLKRHGRLQPITFHYSNLGSAESLNSFGDKARVDRLAFFTPAIGPYFGCVGIGDHLSLGVSYPSDEIATEEIDRVLAAADRSLSGPF